MPRRILYLSQWFLPEPITAGHKLARGLQARGFDVEVLTGFPNYPSGKLAPGYCLSPHMREEIDGVAVHRVFLFPSHDRSSIGRMLNYLSFFLSAFLFCLFRARRYDLIYVYHPPITTGLAAALSGLITRKPFMLEVQDLWPDSVAASGMSATSALSRILGPICNFVYRRAAFVFGQSEGMTARLVERGVSSERADVFFNWADEEAARPNGLYDVAMLNFEGRFNFVYAGNLGTVQALETLVKAAHLVAREVPHVQLTLIGNGTERMRLENLVRDLGASNIQICDGIPPLHIGDVLAAADVLVAHLKDDPLFQITIPSKTQFYLAMGKPILIGVSGAAAQIVTEAGAGIVVPPEDVDALSKAMLHLASLQQSELDAMGVCGRKAYDTRFAFDSTVSHIASQINRVMEAECR